MRPKIAVLMDENTSTGGARYEAHKGYFQGVIDAGGAPFGVPYALEIVADIVSDFDGLLAVGGRYAYPHDWYVEGRSLSPLSPRFEAERALMSAFLAADKPVIGICAGMQMLAALHGSKLAPDIAELTEAPHNQKDYLHEVAIRDGTLLHRLIGANRLSVNSFHNEAVVALGEGVVASAHAPDGIIEAIEIPAARFALGIQWHQELFVGSDHAGAKVFDGLVNASGG